MAPTLSHRAVESWRRARSAYERHRLAWQLAAFAAGFLFDAVAAAGAGVDHKPIVIQQIVYSAVIGAILLIEFVREARPPSRGWPAGLERLWEYRGLAVHFCLGTLMNLYSIFFLLSASLSASMGFVILLFAAIALNEFGEERRWAVDVRIGLYVICVFCFFSLMIPLALGHVGTLPFVLAFVSTLGVVFGFFLLLRRVLGTAGLGRRLLLPALSVSACFLVFYLVGWIPPVPVAARRLGVYHKVERHGDVYTLFYERPWWKFWRSDDEHFRAEPGDRVYAFVSIVSPPGFSDMVYVHWAWRDPSGAWQDTDRVPIRFTGGREGGYRGYIYKNHCAAGDWRVTIETVNGAEVGRLRFTVTDVPVNQDRRFVTDTY